MLNFCFENLVGGKEKWKLKTSFSKFQKRKLSRCLNLNFSKISVFFESQNFSLFKILKLQNFVIQNDKISNFEISQNFKISIFFLQNSNITECLFENLKI